MREGPPPPPHHTQPERVVGRLTYNRPSPSLHFLSFLGVELASGGGGGGRRSPWFKAGLESPLTSQGQPGVEEPLCVFVRGWLPGGPFRRQTPTSGHQEEKKGQEPPQQSPLILAFAFYVGPEVANSRGDGGGSAGLGACLPGESPEEQQGLGVGGPESGSLEKSWRNSQGTGPPRQRVCPLRCVTSSRYVSFLI